MNIPIAHSSESIERFLEHIETKQVPIRVTPDYLRDNGFTSGNDGELRQIFRLLDFLDDEDIPTARWRAYQQSDKEVLRQAVEECYAGLFALYAPSPFIRTDAELRTWFRPPVTADSKSSIERAIRTFRKLYVLAGMTTAEKPVDDAKRDESVPFHEETIPTALDQSKVVLQLPVLAGRAQYVELMQAIKEVFL